MKTEAEILAAHKSTIELFTGKECDIKLISDEEKALKSLTLVAIQSVVNIYSFLPVESRAKDPHTTSFRKIFVMIAREAGYNLSSIGNHLSNRKHNTILYNEQSGKNLLFSDTDFQTNYKRIKQILLQPNKILAKKG